MFFLPSFCLTYSLMILLDGKCKNVTFQVRFIEPQGCINFAHLPVKFYALERKTAFSNIHHHIKLFCYRVIVLDR